MKRFWQYSLFIVLVVIVSFLLTFFTLKYTGQIIYINEGESGPVDPGYECLEGLTAISCDRLDESGACQSCEGFFYCTKCGDGECKGPENVCNCVQDCGTEPGGNIFVTSSRFTGNLGGLKGADEKCQQAAGNAGYKGTWAALLSTLIVDAGDRLPEDTDFRNMKGFIVAYNQTDLSDGRLLNHILTEYGEKCEENCLVWTGSYAHAGIYHYIFYTEQSCNDWTTSEDDVRGTSGNAKYWNEDWMEWNIMQSCSVESSIYCVRIR